MSTETSMLKMSLTPDEVRKKLRLHGWCWKSGGAALGLGLGILAPVAGSILTAIAWFTAPHWHGFFIQRYGTVLLFLTIPLLIFGGHCLDLMDKDEAAKRRNRQAE
jgi:hypothetical protein